MTIVSTEQAMTTDAARIAVLYTLMDGFTDRG